MKRAALLLLAACGTDSQLSTDASTDASSGSDAVMGGASRCSGDTTLACTSHTVTVGGRKVTYELPLGTPPSAGWPTVVFYQGSFIPGDRAFSAAQGASFGQYQLTSTVKALLDAGYAVIAPNAEDDGAKYWQTNVPPHATNWAGCPDDVFIQALLGRLADGTFGALDADHRYAMGISSGGYMTSRMAISYAGQFRALAIASASYATCGVSCSVPTLPADHPPTLFLHGSTDTIVRESTMTPYRNALGSKADAIIDANAGHEWLAAAVTAVPAFFAAH